MVATALGSANMRSGSSAKGMGMGEFTSVSTLEGDAQFDAYVAKPEGEPTAAIIVIQ